MTAYFSVKYVLHCLIDISVKKCTSDINVVTSDFVPVKGGLSGQGEGMPGLGGQALEWWRVELSPVGVQLHPTLLALIVQQIKQVQIESKRGYYHLVQ